MNKGKLQRAWETTVDIGLDIWNNHEDFVVGTMIALLFTSLFGTIISIGLAPGWVAMLFSIPIDMLILGLITWGLRILYKYIRRMWERTNERN